MSIFRKIVAWVVAATVVALVGLALTSWLAPPIGPGRVDMMLRTLMLQSEGAARALDVEGLSGLKAYLRRLDELFEARHYLLTAQGVDLVSGEDRSEWLSAAPTPPRPPHPNRGPGLVAADPDAKGRRLLIRFDPPRPVTLLPYFLWILVVILGLGYALAVNLARPLRKLERAVESFGGGDLSVRLGSTRKDEIGQLSRAFDQMAGRIESLLASERRLLSDVSHELRSPLARLGFAAELARTSDDRDAAVDRIRRDLDRLSHLISELLELSRGQDRGLVKFERLDLNRRLAELIDECSIEAGAKGCAIVGENWPEATALGDWELARRAVENVIRNAIRHAPEGSTIDVSLGHEPGFVRIEVRDRGEGVPETEIEAIFQPFHRVGPSRSRRDGGAGLGLAIARRSLELQGGTIAATNADPGLRVALTLPVA